MRKKPRIPGMTATKSHQVPKCSADPSHLVHRDESGEWFCVQCADDWLKSYVESHTRGSSVGGVALPSGVTDPRRDLEKPTFRELFPNRAARRRMAR